MLLPDYNELVALKSQTSRKGIGGVKRALAQTLGGHQSKFKGRGLDFAEFREYAPGDEIRNIDWRVTARVGRPHSKLFMEERERNVYVVLDFNDYMNFGTRVTFKSIQAARAAAYIGWSANQCQDRFGAVLFGQVPAQIQIHKAKRTRRSLSSLLKTLSMPPSTTGFLSLSDALVRAKGAFEAGSKIYVISDFVELSDHFEMQIAALTRRCEVTLIRISDRADTEISPFHPLRLTDGKGHIISIDRAQREGVRTYLETSKQRDEVLKKIAHRYHLDMITIGTDDSVVRRLQR